MQNLGDFYFIFIISGSPCIIARACVGARPGTALAQRCGCATRALRWRQAGLCVGASCGVRITGRALGQSRALRWRKAGPCVGVYHKGDYYGGEDFDYERDCEFTVLMTFASYDDDCDCDLDYVLMVFDDSAHI